MDDGVFSTQNGVLHIRNSPIAFLNAQPGVRNTNMGFAVTVVGSQMADGGRQNDGSEF